MLQFQFVVCLFVRVSKKCGATWVWFLPIYWALWECEFGSKSEEKRKEKKEKNGLFEISFVCFGDDYWCGSSINGGSSACDY